MTGFVKNMIIILGLFALTGFSMQTDLARSKTTAHFRIHYEKGVTEADVRLIGENLESAYAHYSKLFGLTFRRSVEVRLFKTAGRFRMESESPLFEDGFYRSGRLYIMAPPDDENTEGKKNLISRLVSRAVLERIPSCPEWLKVGYSFLAGRDLDRFGPPVRVNLSQFSDLGEDYNRSVSKKEIRELYAKIASTIEFFLSRHGEQALIQIFNRFKTEDSLPEVLESAFNEKIDEIEEAWVKHLESVEQRK